MVLVYISRIKRGVLHLESDMSDVTEEARTIGVNQPFECFRIPPAKDRQRSLQFVALDPGKT